MQIELYSLYIEYDYPYDPTTAVLKRKVRAEDGLTYAAKGKEHPNKYIPVNEWVCANIAYKIGIPIPEFKILKDFDESLLFGSRWAAGVKSHVEFHKHVENPLVYSSIFAFDMLILNQDRHMGNYLLQEIDGRTKLLAFDHSHSLLHSSPLPAPNEAKFFPQMRTTLLILSSLGLKIDKTKFDMVMSRFRNIEEDFFDTIVSDCINTKWLEEKEAQQLSEWLKNRYTCIEHIYKEIERWDYDPVSILSGVFGA